MLCHVMFEQNFNTNTNTITELSRRKFLQQAHFIWKYGINTLDRNSDESCTTNIT